MTLTDYNNKLYSYLKSKLPDVPEHTIMEIAAHLTNMTAIAVNDEVQKFADEIKRRERRKYPPMKCISCEHRFLHDPVCNDCIASYGFKYYQERKS